MKIIVQSLALVLFALLFWVLFTSSQDIPLNKATPIVKESKPLGALNDITQLKNDEALNKVIDNTIDSINKKEEDYKSANGKDFQVLPTHSVPPDYGTESIGDKLDSKPDYQNYSASDAGLTTNLPFSLKIDQYKAPDSSVGYIASFTVKIGSERYSKIISSGVNALQYSHDWQKDEKPY